jgi:hypothetical protein
MEGNRATRFLRSPGGPGARALRPAFVVVALLVTALLGDAGRPLSAQEDEESPDTRSTQLWLAYQAFRPLNNKRLVLHFEGRTNGPGDDAWASIDGRTRVDFYPLPWLDVYPEALLRYTEETQDLDSFQATLRGGVRFKVPSTQEVFNFERVPLQRFDFGVLLRLEWRNFFYSGGETDSSWRGRIRAEAKFPLNHKSMGEDKTVYVRGDAEAFIPLGDESPETFANRWRFRLGGGYRITFTWRVEALGIWQQSRNTLEEDFKTTEFMLSLRLRHYF